MHARIVRILRRLRRSAVPYWTVAAVMAFATVQIVRDATQATDPAAKWGEATPVVVLRRPVYIGQTLRAQDLARGEMPATVAPRRRLVETAQARGRVVLAHLEPGDVLSEHHLAPQGLQGIAALVPAGRRAIGLPADATTPALRPGDQVDVLATFPPGTRFGTEPSSENSSDTVPIAPTILAARGAVVLETTDRRVTVAVTAEEAARVAYASANAAITMLLTPPGG